MGQWLRLFQIAYIWLKFGLDDIVLNVPWLRAFRFIVYLNPLNWCRPKLSEGERLRLAFEALGPIFVKFGQILSTRRDFLPDHIAIALARLQDQVKPFPGAQAVKEIEAALGQKVADVFDDFDPKPLASASIAQVHSAHLKTGESVVIKILRPGIRRTIERDIRLMYLLARICQRTIKASRRLRPLEIVGEVERTIIHELDLMREGANATQLKRNAQKYPHFYVPQIYWEHSRETILVLEKISGTQIHNIAALKAKNTDMKLLADRLFDVFYNQVFDDCFFHADLHPGNLFVADGPGNDPTIIAVDFGIVGTLNKDDQRYLATNFLAFFKRDYRKVAEVHIESGWVPATTVVEELEMALRSVCEPIFDKPLKDISMGQTLMRLIQIAQQFDMTIQPQLLLLQKTILNIEGLGQSLYPDLNLWNTAKPYLENWMKRQMGLKGFVQRLKKELPNLSYHLPEMPELLISLLKEQRLKQRKAHDGLNQKTNLEQNRSFWKTPLLAIGGGVLVYSFLSVISGGQKLNWQHLVSSHLAAVGVVGFVILLLGILKR